MRDVMREFICCERGATSIEYGLIAALIAVVIIGAITTVGTKMKAKFMVVANNLN